MTPTDDRHVLALLYPGSTLNEIVETVSRLALNGFRVVTVAPDGGEVVDAAGLRIAVDEPVGAVDPARAAAIVVPGGDPSAVLGDERVRGLLRSASASGVLVATICAGALVAADAGLVAGRRITHNYRPPWAPEEVTAFAAPYWDGAVVEPDPSVGVVRDGNLVTALPNASIDLAVTVCVALGLYDDARADRIARHLRGEYVAELFAG